MGNEDIERLRGEIAALRAEIAQVAQAVTILADDQAVSASDGGDEDSWQDVVPVIGGGGEAQGAFAVVDGKITNRHYMVARTVHNMSGNDPDAEDGTWYLVVPHASPGSATLTRNPSGYTDDTQTVIPLFTIVNGKITADYRGMPLVMIRE